MDRLRIGIVGCGGMGGAHGRRLEGMEEGEIAALCDLTEEIAGRLRERGLGGDGADIPLYAGTPAV